LDEQTDPFVTAHPGDQAAQGLAMMSGFTPTEIEASASRQRTAMTRIGGGGKIASGLAGALLAAAHGNLFLALHQADTYLAGWLQLVTGEEQRTFTATWASKSFETFGMDKEQAWKLGNLVDAAAPFLLESPALFAALREAATTVGGEAAAARAKFVQMAKGKGVPPELADQLADAYLEAKRAGLLDGNLEARLSGAQNVAPQTPSGRINRWTRSQGGYIDPETNKWVQKPVVGGPQIQSGHIYPSSRIKELPGFDQLTRAQQDWLLNHPDNFIPLPRQWNASMGNRLADEWATTERGSHASKEFIDQLREGQQAFERMAKDQIATWLDK
jgi:hypothetical protein